MSQAREILEAIIQSFAPEAFIRFFREKSREGYRPSRARLQDYNDDDFEEGNGLGEIDFQNGSKLIVCAFKANNDLTERSSRKKQYEKAKTILKSLQSYNAGIFIYYDQAGRFRFSLIYPESIGTKRLWNSFRRFTYFVDREFTNKTFLKQIGDGSFETLDRVKEAFSLMAVTKLFYDEFFVIYNKIVDKVKQVNRIKEYELARDFVLLFSIRSIFLGFIQKKKWIGNNDRFMSDFLNDYKKKKFGTDQFYNKWLVPLFFEALNSPPGRKVAYQVNDFSSDIESALQMAPFLNGGLFKRKDGYDDNDWIIPDKEIDSFFEFLYSYAFTIEENSLEDEDLQLNPEFLGIIFERLVNKEDGAVYTPRTEVDLMCRLSLVKWLQKNLTSKVSVENLYELFFKESELEEEQKKGSFSKKEAEEILSLLENISICDPAVGSGAFLVGMMQVMDEVECSLRERYHIPEKDPFERKKEIIRKTLYGVEVKEWAVWICQLRLWLSLFVDAPYELKNSQTAILPSLEFKVRQGDSLVQRIGSKAFPITGHLHIQSAAIKDKITKLKNLKVEYFDNKTQLIEHDLHRKELAVYGEIIDLEIAEKEKELRRYVGGSRAKPVKMFDDEPEQQEIDLHRNKKEKLKSDIAALKDQKEALRDSEKPLIWSIEFAEVFTEKSGFDIVIGNPPYVRQEDISDPNGKIKDKKEYKSFLAEMVKMDFPRDFPPTKKINAKSDLYTYFYIRGLKLLNKNGIHTFICSNSWLDVGYGVWLQEFLLNSAQIEMILDNHAKRSFEAADVNTIISVIHAPRKNVNQDHRVKFVAYKRPFEEAVFTENMLAIERTNNIMKTDIFRVYPLKVEELKDAGTEYEEGGMKGVGRGKYTGDKWGGKYLRAPDIFFTILEKGKDKMVRLGNIAEMSFGIKTGADSFFYLSKEQVKAKTIEKEFLTPILVSSDQVKSFLTSSGGTDIYLVTTSKPKANIKGTAFYRYIIQGETERFHGRKEDSIPKDRPSCKSHSPFWYSIQIPKAPPIYWMEMRRERYFTLLNDAKLAADHTFYGIYPKDNIDSISLCGILNSTIIPLFVEVFANDPGGGGTTLQTPIRETKRYVMLPKSLIGSKLLIKCFQELTKRHSRSIIAECGFDPESNTPIEEQVPNPLPDRAELDKVVFDALGLTEEERKEVYRAVCRLVWNRLSKARSV